MSTKTSTADGWRRLLRKHRKSRLTVAAFCRRAGVSQPSFYAWPRKLRHQTGFAKVKLATCPVAELGGIELLLRHERRIVVRPDSDRRTLLELVEALESAPAAMIGELPTRSPCLRSRSWIGSTITANQSQSGLAVMLGPLWQAWNAAKSPSSTSLSLLMSKHKQSAESYALLGSPTPV